MKKKILIMATCVVLTLVLSAGLAYGGACSPATFTLWSGNHPTNVGTVTVTNDDNYLYVTYNPSSGYSLSAVHLAVVTDLANIPVTDNGSSPGNPIPGHFPWKMEFNSPSPSYTFAIAKTDLTFSVDCATPMYIVAQADLSPSGGAFAGDTLGPTGSRWWYYFQYSWCCSGDPVTVCEQTAFAKSDASNCFLNNGFNRWGWTNGPFSSPGTYTMDLYAAVGQCDTGTKGMFVGEVTVDYSNDGTVTVTYTTIPGITLTQTHLYVGNDPYPTQKKGNNVEQTVAPGQYGNIHEGLTGSTDTFTVNASGPIYIIAHAIVEGADLCGLSE